MASGNPSLTITRDTAWDTFPDQAADFVRKFNGIVVARVNNGVDQMWIVLIKWRPFFLTFEDLPLRITLDSMSRCCAPVIGEIHAKLLDETISKNRPWHRACLARIENSRCQTADSVRRPPLAHAVTDSLRFRCQGLATSARCGIPEAPAGILNFATLSCIERCT